MASPLNTLSVYTPTMRERIVNWFAQNWYGDTREGYDQANKLMDVLQFTPVGAAADIYDVGRAIGTGDYATAGLTAAMAGVPGPTPKGFRAFHGSPHSFDKFSTSKIGTGEGAQAYGKGLYFAESEDVAQGYKEALKPGKGTSPEDTAARILEASGGDRDAAIEALRESYNRAVQQGAPYEDTQRLMAARNILNTAPERATGSMYEVNIAADPNTFLDWDKPLSEQPANVREAMAPWAYMDVGGPAGDILRWDMKQGGKLSEYLAQKGIPGIRYLDAGSRVSPAMAAKELADWKAQLPIAEQELADAIKRNDKWLIGRKQAEVQRVKDGLAQAIKGAEGTRNYVVFDDKLISIVRKYGIAGASAMLGYNLLENVSEAQAEELRQIEKGAK